MSDRVQLRRQRRAIVRSEVLAGGARDLDARRAFNRRLAHMLQGGEQTMSATDLFATASETGGRRGADGFEDARESAFMASPTGSTRSRSWWPFAESARKGGKTDTLFVRKFARDITDHFAMRGAPLNEGAQGTVFSMPNDPGVVLKVIELDGGDVGEALQDAEREALYTERMGQEGIGPVLYSWGRVEDSATKKPQYALLIEKLKPFCTDRLIDGKYRNDLAQKLQDGTARAKQLSRLITKMANAGFIHTDLKCGNVMLNADNQIRFIDFDPDFVFSDLKAVAKGARMSITNVRGAASLLMHMLCSVTMSTYPPPDRRALFRNKIKKDFRPFWTHLGTILATEQSWRMMLKNKCFMRQRNNEACTTQVDADCRIDQDRNGRRSCTHPFYLGDETQGGRWSLQSTLKYYSQEFLGRDVELSDFTQ